MIITIYTTNILFKGRTTTVGFLLVLQFPPPIKLTAMI